MTGERRRYPRMRVAWPARVWVGEVSFVGRVVDASAYGLGAVMESATPLQLNDSCRVDILPTNRRETSRAGAVRQVSNERLGIETDRLVPLHADELLL